MGSKISLINSDIIETKRFLWTKLKLAKVLNLFHIEIQWLNLNLFTHLSIVPMKWGDSIPIRILILGNKNVSSKRYQISAISLSTIFEGYFCKELLKYTRLYEVFLLCLPSLCPWSISDKEFQSLKARTDCPKAIWIRHSESCCPIVPDTLQENLRKIVQ